jgi:NSS family neurotransmitter:Na+ symporter
MEREKLSSRLGFILLSAGCAIGVGNVWRFPYVVGQSGGGAFLPLYFFFLIIIGLPIMTMEFSVGRASRRSIARIYDELAPEGTRRAWKVHSYASLAGNCILMMFYTTVSGWMLNYFLSTAMGRFVGMDATAVSDSFSALCDDPVTMTVYMAMIVIAGFFICSLGLQGGVERISKFMMLALLGIMIVLAIHGFTQKGAAEGLSFYLEPDLSKIDLGVVVDAMNQAFFTLSLGIGSMAVFGSYIGKDRALLGESVNVIVLDTFVAFVSGLIIFPACFTFGIAPGAGPGLIFVTLPNVFNSMTGGRVWGSMFFLFMTFAAFTTVLAVFENLIACLRDLLGPGRKKACLISCVAILILSMPCVLGFNLLSAFAPFGEGSSIMDLEDFIVSSCLLPLGSLTILLFCTWRRGGWGWERFVAEANTGRGLKMRSWMRGYVTYILPLIITTLFVIGIVTKFV